MKLSRRSLLPLSCLILGASACGGTIYQPGRSIRIDPQPDREIDDEAIRLAFEASPQMPARVRVAYFNLAPERDEEIVALFGNLPEVSGVYRIPPLLVTGRRRFDRESAEPQQLSVKRLRLLAARAQCDLLVLFDYGYRVTVEPNGWVALNVLLVPALFAPFLDASAESYLDAYVVDVRNGYLYGQISEAQEGERDELTVWSDAEERMVDEQWGRLLTAIGDRLVTILAQRAPESPQ